MIKDIYKSGFNNLLQKVGNIGRVTMRKISAEAFNHKRWEYIKGDSRRDTSTQSTGASWTNVPDTELIIDITRPTRVFLMATAVSTETNTIMQMRLNSTGYGTAASIFGASRSTSVITTLQPGKYTFGLRYRDTAGGTAEINDRTITYILRSYNYIGE